MCVKQTPYKAWSPHMQGTHVPPPIGAVEISLQSLRLLAEGAGTRCGARRCGCSCVVLLQGVQGHHPRTSASVVALWLATGDKQFARYNAGDHVISSLHPSG